MNYPYIQIEIDENRKKLYAQLKEEYNPVGSKLCNYQCHLTNALIEFDKFCSEHDIHYSLAYGTMLGAIRHKGFIPWDDDADILMMRDDFDKLLSLLYGKYNSLTDKIGLAMGIRPTIWMAPYAYIDIFVLDASPNNILLRTVKFILSECLYCIVKCRNQVDNGGPKKIKFYDILLPIALVAKKQKWMNIWRKISMIGNNNIKNDKLQAYNNIPSYVSQRFSKNDVRQHVLVDFEGYKFPIFGGYDNILKTIYGDYMKLPKHLHIHGIVNNIEVANVTK